MLRYLSLAGYNLVTSNIILVVFWYSIVARAGITNLSSYTYRGDDSSAFESGVN